MPTASEAIVRARVSELTSIALAVEVYALPDTESFASQDDVITRCRSIDGLPLVMELMVSVSEPAATSACGASVVNKAQLSNRFDIVRSRRDLGSNE